MQNDDRSVVGQYDLVLHCSTSSNKSMLEELNEGWIMSAL